MWSEGRRIPHLRFALFKHSHSSFHTFSTEQLLLMKHLNIWCWRSSLKTLQAQQLHLLKLSKFCQSLEILWMRTLKVFCFCRKGQKTVIVTGVGCRAARRAKKKFKVSFWRLLYWNIKDRNERVYKTFRYFILTN